jgi:hypothetical protein
VTAKDAVAAVAAVAVMVAVAVVVAATAAERILVTHRPRGLRVVSCASCPVRCARGECAVMLAQVCAGRCAMRGVMLAQVVLRRPGHLSAQGG